MTAEFLPHRLRNARALLIAALALALISIAGAWFFELALGYAPCKLCLMQRWPYYIGLPIGLAALAVGPSSPIGRALIVLTILAFLASAAMGVYHAGAEWKFWAGPTDCGGRIQAGPSSVLDLRKSLQTTKVIRCDEAALRVLGLSFPGWNVVASLGVAALAALALFKGRYGSSSVSQ